MKDFNEFSTPYAIVRIFGSREYGHIEMLAYNTVSNISPLVFEASCQIGSSYSFPSEDQKSKTYAWEFGVKRGNLSPMNLSQLELAVKKMRSVDRKLDKIEDRSGTPQDFAEYLFRILVSIGVERVFINPAFGGGYDRLIELPNYETGFSTDLPIMRRDLGNLERRLIETYSGNNA